MPAADYSAPTSMGGMYGEDAPEQRMPDKAPDEKRENQDDSETAVIPKSFFGSKDLTPGTECKVKIERVMDNEVMVSYVPHDEKDDKEEEARRGEMAQGGEGDAMPQGQPSMYD